VRPRWIENVLLGKHLHGFQANSPAANTFAELLAVQTVKHLYDGYLAIIQMAQKYLVFKRKYSISLRSNNQRGHEWADRCARRAVANAQDRGVSMSEGGKRMSSRNAGTLLYLSVFMFVAAIPATSQSFRVQCPTSTITHPDPGNVGVNNAEPAYTAPTFTTGQGYVLNGAGHVNGAIKCQQISGGDGYATMGDGTQTYMFSFGPLSGLSNIALGLPGTDFPSTFNNVYAGTLVPGDPATTDDAGGGQGAFIWNGAVGLMGDPFQTRAAHWHTVQRSLRAALSKT
jgi:hypothetical protein